MTMNNFPLCYGIIPARYGSTRFPGKPLTPILGKPMFWHVFQRARQCPEFIKIILATDDDRIMVAAKELEVPVMMTRSDHRSGSDRVLEAAMALELPEHAVVVNIQGDEPALEPAMLSELLAPFKNPEVRVATMASRLDPQEAAQPDRVKVVLSKKGRAIYFSRAPIPYPAQGDHHGSNYYLHIGLYAFRMDTLKLFSVLEPGDLEKTEKLEQLRLLENHIPIEVVLTKHRSVGVDRLEDVATVSKLLVQRQDLR
jgi:3-deoxy-manno-octulosonate cytidylyltransferase (CMP-KDO synthetase)